MRNPAKESEDDVVLGRFDRKFAANDRIFRLLNTLLRLFFWPRASSAGSLRQPPKRVLLANAGHLGDLIVSTAIVATLKKAFPEVEIGFLSGSHSRGFFEIDPSVTHVHCVDHWYMRRDPLPRWRKALQYWLSLPRIIREIRRVNYDVAIDLRTWFPNLIPLLWWTRIPVRIGSDRVGWAPLLTHIVPYARARKHELAFLLDLLAPLDLPKSMLASVRPVLPAISEQALAEVRAVTGGVETYHVLHPCSSTASRDWTVAGWIDLALFLKSQGITPIITGAGSRDAAIASSITEIVPGCVNAVNHLSWQALMALLSRAGVVYSVETSIGHAASALGRQVIAIYGGMADPVHWAPFGSKVVTNKVDCHPCFIRAGCETRQCLNGITAEDVKRALRDIAV